MMSMQLAHTERASGRSAMTRAGSCGAVLGETHTDQSWRVSGYRRFIRRTVNICCRPSERD